MTQADVVLVGLRQCDAPVAECSSCVTDASDGRQLRTTDAAMADVAAW
jgi:hypothetical protein